MPALERFGGLLQRWAGSDNGHYVNLFPSSAGAGVGGTVRRTGRNIGVAVTQGAESERPVLYRLVMSAVLFTLLLCQSDILYGQARRATAVHSQLQDGREVQNDPEDAEDSEVPDTQQVQELANREFLGIRFGLGFGMTMDFGSARADEAELIDGIVRVTKRTNHRPRMLLETHYFWKARTEARTVTLGGTTLTIDAAHIGWGPFMAIQTSDEEVVEVFAGGLMVGLKKAGQSSFNIGFGIALDPSAKALGDGIMPNEPLPQGETEIRFKEEPRWGPLVLVSFSF